LSERYAGLYRILTHKYYVDEFYDWLIVRPICVASDKFLWRKVDAGAVDGVLVDGTGHASASVGGVLRRMQSGNIRSYATWVLLGAVLWLLYVFVTHA
jgi:NADH-quinone oxidoreductase subunit L